MAPKHRHHIVPKYAGGKNDPLNVTPPISIRLHAMFHFDRWRHVGDVRDYAAYRMLLGKIGREEARILVVSRLLTGRTFSPETIQKMRDAHKGRDRATYFPITPQKRAAIAARRRGKKEFIAAAIAAVPAANRSRIWTEESRRKLAEANRRRWANVSEDGRAAMLQGLRRPKTPETRLKMSAALKGLKRSDATKRAISVVAKARSAHRLRDGGGRWR